MRSQYVDADADTRVLANRFAAAATQGKSRQGTFPYHETLMLLFGTLTTTVVGCPQSSLSV